MPIDNRKSTSKSLTWREISDRLTTDFDYPSQHRAYDASRVRKSLEWDAAPTWHASRSPIKRQSRFIDRPFNRQTIDELFDSLRPSELKISQKTLANSRSACKRVADYYKAPRGIGYTPLTEDCERLLALLPSKWDRRDLMSGMHYLSHVGISPWALTDAAVAEFRRSLAQEFRLADPITTFNMFTRTWNKCVTIPGWPQVTLTRDVVAKRRPAINWADYSALETAIDAYLASGYSGRMTDHDNDEHEIVLDFEDDDVLQPLSPISIRNHKSSLGMAVWALQNDGVPREALVSLRGLCVPARFRQALRGLIARAGGAVNRTVKARADALYRLAKHPAVLSKEELKSVAAAHDNCEKRHVIFLRTHEDRDQLTLDKLDDPSVMDAFLSLPTLTKNQVLAKRNRHTIGSAYAIQRALILELWLCVPYRIGAFTSIELEQIMTMRLDAVERVLVRGPKKQSANKKSPEHFLNADTIALLQLYIDEFRPLIAAHNKSVDSPHLFPGVHGRAKAIASLRTQMTRFVRKKTSLKDWHPHLIRKISPKITLDADPGALEVARRTGGWANDRMLHQVYGQRVHRASQARYLELLEGRRLSSIRAISGRQSRK